MECFIEKNISCENNNLAVRKCSDTIIDKLEKKFNCCMKSISDTDKPNGYVSIIHEKNNHKITVYFYEDTTKLKPLNKGGIKKLSNIPTESEIKKII